MLINRFIASLCFAAVPAFVLGNDNSQFVSKQSSAADHAVVEALLRIPNATLGDFPEQEQAVTRHLRFLASEDPSSYVRVAQQLQMVDRPETLLKIVSDPDSGQTGIEAAKLLIRTGHVDHVAKHLASVDDDTRIAAISAIGFAGGNEAVTLLKPWMQDQDQPQTVRSAAATALGKNWHGQQWLLNLAKSDTVPENLQFEISNALLGSYNKEIAKAASQLKNLRTAVAGESKPLPPVAKLARMSGDPKSGKQVFMKEGTCANCHKVNGEGKEVGPDLSEIGSKLSREDLHVAILNPSAGVSHNYETYSVLTVDGQIFTGILVNETEEEVSIKTADAVLKTIAAEEVEDLFKQEVSLMPADLQKAMTTQQLVDLVDYLSLLQKPGQKRFNAIAAQGGKKKAATHEPTEAIDGFEIADGLKVQLFAYEPQLLSPTSIDVDHLGRVWVCEAVNYRHFRNPNNEPREEGDRILVMEDTNGDGAADKSTVFYQGHDIDSPHGVCFLGDRVIVSAGENVFVLQDTDGDLRADEKTVLFTGISGVQHDHGIHSFMPGPDGKLYFNFGNEGKQLKTADGKPVIDLAGNEVNDTRNPYQQGMVFRCDLDGSNVETLGWNFRNNWEVVVDSYGALWQSDNDDDGNRGTRINFVMEYGNYGYRNEKSGDYWRSERIGMREAIGQRHWHLNDPGVIPNLLQTGAGSPTGITVYEGKLLPEVYQNQVIHTDPGPNVVRAYPVQDSGAGYSATIQNMIRGVQDQWFRPVDVCVAPDGSLIVADWYDPGVGGHRMGDTTRGRLFRITVAGHEDYSNPPPNFSTFAGAAAALASPNRATQFLAGNAIKAMWKKNPPNLQELLADRSVNDPRIRARWFWLLAKTPSTSKDVILAALSADDPNLRMAAVRAARQTDSVDTLMVVETLVDDDSPQVRRELAIALAGSDSPEAVELWTQVALQHDGQDRWYLEALGIGARGKWDACFDGWLTQVGDQWNSAKNRDIVWRSRSKKSADYLARLIVQSPTVQEQQRYFRALEFFDAEPRKAAFRSIVAGIR